MSFGEREAGNVKDGSRGERKEKWLRGRSRSRKVKKETLMPANKDTE